MRLKFNILALLTVSACSSPVVALDEIPVDDHQGVYRLDPEIERSKLILVPAEEIKPGLTYNYYSQVLGRRVWGFATEDHSFEYAFGTGTIVPTSRFDLRLSAAAQERILDERAPRLKQALEGLGRTPAVQLDAAGQWSLLSYPSSARVFDLLSGQRWEWHGKRRLGVVSVYGNLWQIVDGEYEPLVFGGVVCR